MLKIVFLSEVPAQRVPAIFIDRDGVVNCRRPGDYVVDYSQFTFMPGIKAALRQLSALGLPMIVISNQAAVGKGLLDVAGLQKITARMEETLREEGTILTAAYYCVHRSDADCACRKPKPELLYRAANDFNIDLSRSVFIGDSETDVRAAHAAGCGPVLFGPGVTNHSASNEWIVGLPVAHAAKDIFDVVTKSLQRRGTVTPDHVSRYSGPGT